MPTKIGISFKNRRFLRLIPTFLADKTDVFSIKNQRFLREKARNKSYFCSYHISKTRLYAMQTWQIAVFNFLFRKKSQR